MCCLLGDKFHHLLADSLSNEQQGLYGVVLLADDEETLFTCQVHEKCSLKQPLN